MHIRCIFQIAADCMNEFIHDSWANSSGIEGSSCRGARSSTAQQPRGI